MGDWEVDPGSALRQLQEAPAEREFGPIRSIKIVKNKVMPRLSSGGGGGGRGGQKNFGPRRERKL